MAELDVDQLADMSLDDMLETLSMAAENRKFNKLDFFKPYSKQKEFFELGASRQERMLFAGNRAGKSEAGAAETAYHLTGRYPEWWKGRRWDRPVFGWAAGESTTLVRDVTQTKLCGPPGLDSEFGSGYIPRDCFADKPTLARGAVGDSYDTIVVHHQTNGVRDGISTLQFKSYEQGRKKFQGSEVDFVWWDEEPDNDIYTEGNARWTSTSGMSYMTFTPLQGYSKVVCLFLHATDEDLKRRGWVRMGLKDALHMTPEMIEDALAKYPKHEHEARINGEPLLGSGQIFIVDRSLITFPASTQIPLEFAKIWGVDFGINHPFGAVLLAWDREEDTIYVLNCYKSAGTTPLVHCAAINAIAPDIPVAWPHDGHQRDKGSGETLASQYRYGPSRPYGIRMLPEHATYPEGGYSTEAVVQEMVSRFERAPGPGSLLVREDQEPFLQEVGMYHRKDGLIVKFQDDLLSAAMKGIMMRRYARAMPLGFRPRSTGFQQRRMQAEPINPWTGRPVDLDRARY